MAPQIVFCGAIPIMPTLASAKTPRYQELVEAFTAQIQSGTLVPGSRLPSFTEMRDQQGVSQTTIVKVYAHLEREGLIRREPKRGIFVASQERASSGQIGFMGTAFARRSQIPYAAHLVDGIEAVAQREQLRIVLLQKNMPVEPGTVDGILLNDQLVDLPQYLKKRIPVVSVLDAAEGVPSVTADDFGGAKLGVRTLISMGHRRIGALMQSNTPTVHMRIAGYRSALSEAEIAGEPNWLHDPQLPVTAAGYRAWGYESMGLWLRNGWHEMGCTALFVQNDMAAVGVLDALREAGVSVPGELSVLSFDGTEVCEYCWPSLAAVEVPLEQIASTGMELLLRMIRGEVVAPTITMLPAQWKDGDSVRPL